MRITASISFGNEWLAPALTDHLLLHPEVSLDLSLNDRMVDPVDEGYDAAIRIGAPADSSLIARPLRPYTMTICASPGYLKARGIPRTPADLAERECLDFVVGDVGVSWRLQSVHSKRPLQPSRLRANSDQALRQAALHDFGIVMQAEVLLAQDIAAGRLVPILRDHLPAPRPMNVVYPRDRRATPKLTTFIDFMVERLGPAASMPLASLT